jgi:hypothetical protein
MKKLILFRRLSMPDFTVKISEFERKEWVIDETKIRELIDWLNENGEQRYEYRPRNFFWGLLRIFMRRR